MATKKKKKREKVKRYPILKRAKRGVSYISVPQAAKKLRVPLPTIYGWASKGLFQFISKDETGHWMIPSKNLKKPPLPAWHYLSPKNKKKKRFKKVKRTVSKLNVGPEFTTSE